MEDVGAGVQRVGIVRGDHDGKRPLEAVLRALGAPSHWIVGIGIHVALLLGPPVETGQVAVVGAGVHRDEAALAAAHRIPIGPADSEVARSAGDRHGGVVLLRAVHAIGKRVVRDHVVELRGGLVVLLRPREPAVMADVHAAVVALDHPLGIRGIDPQIVVVAMRRADGAEGATAVVRSHALHVEHPDHVGVERIGEDVRVVPGALAQASLLVRLLPCAAAVVRAIDATLVGLDHRPDAIGIGRRDRHAQTSPETLGQTLAGEPLPRLAAIRGFPQPASRTAALQAPRRSTRLPGGGVEHARVARIHAEIHRARAVVHEEHALPRGPAVARAEHAALVIGAEGVAERRHVGDLGIAGIDANAANLPRIAQPHVLPGPAAVVRAIDAVPVRQVPPDAAFPHAGIYDVGIGSRDRDGAHRAGAELAVRHAAPAVAAVGALPDAAARAAEVVDVALASDSGDGHHTTAAIGADRAPFQPAELALVVRICGGLARRGGRGRERGARQGERAGEHHADAEGAHHDGSLGDGRNASGKVRKLAPEAERLQLRRRLGRGRRGWRARSQGFGQMEEIDALPRDRGRAHIPEP